MYQHRLPWIQRGQEPTHTKHINIHLHLALLSEYKVIIDSTGIGVFCMLQSREGYEGVFQVPDKEKETTTEFN